MGGETKNSFLHAYVDTDVIATLMEVSTERILQLVETGYLPHIRYEGRILFKKHEVRKWMKDNLVQAVSGFPLPKTMNVIEFKELLGKADYKDVPGELTGVEGLFECSFGAPPAVYFLVKENRVVYVGRSVSPLSRLEDHRRNKDFDQVFLLPVPEDELDRVEDAFIESLAPPLNGGNRKWDGRSNRFKQLAGD